MKKQTEKEQIYQIELIGNRRVIVDGCRCILEYEPETIKLDLGAQNVRIVGQRLMLRGLSCRSVLIEGLVSTVEFESGAVRA